MTRGGSRWWVVASLVAVSSSCISPPSEQLASEDVVGGGTRPAPGRMHAVWYGTVRQSLIGELAEDTGSPSPRSVAIANVDQHFGAIRNRLGANTVVIRL